MNISQFVGNWIDLVIIIILLLYLVRGLEKGFFSMTADLVSFFASLFLAFRFYPGVSQLLSTYFTLPLGVSKALGFFALAVFAEAILGVILGLVVRGIPELIRKNLVNKILGLIPAVLDGFIIVSFFLIILVSLPISPIIKQQITSSQIGGPLLVKTAQVENQFKAIFGEAIEQSLTFLTVKPSSGERIDLRFTVSDLTIDEASETKMFALVNQARRENGLKELKWDTKLVVVGRQHSEDMFGRGYFSHYSPEGKDVGDRLGQSNITYLVAGENLAYAPSVTLAHTGLMNSPGHRANILSPQFSRVGIGAIDGGIYSKMFTQVFIN
ncbi:MAG: CvpA family protein [bacterium]|nr:CvpA family protein [bacterium]